MSILQQVIIKVVVWKHLSSHVIFATACKTFTFRVFSLAHSFIAFAEKFAGQQQKRYQLLSSFLFSFFNENFPLHTN